MQYHPTHYHQHIHTLNSITTIPSIQPLHPIKLQFIITTLITQLHSSLITNTSINNTTQLIHNTPFITTSLSIIHIQFNTLIITTTYSIILINLNHTYQTQHLHTSNHIINNTSWFHNTYQYDNYLLSSFQSYNHSILTYHILIVTTHQSNQSILIQRLQTINNRHHTHTHCLSILFEE